MNAELDLTLCFDGECWVTDIGQSRLRAGELQDLEERIIQTVREMPRFADQDRVRLRLVFDFNTFPPWLRQYQSHYFNSCLTVPMLSVRRPATSV